MITAEMTFARTDRGTRCGLTITGHADYAEAGQDIVCASASMLFYALVETLQEDGFRATVKEEPGDAMIETGTERGFAAMKIRHYFTVAKCGFAALARDYPGNVKFILKITQG